MDSHGLSFNNIYIYINNTHTYIYICIYISVSICIHLVLSICFLHIFSSPARWASIYTPKAMQAQNWIPQHWIQLHGFCNLVCYKPQKSLMLSAVLDPEHSLGTLSEFGDLVPVVSPKGICIAENLKILNDRLNICRVSPLELGHPATGSKRRRPAQVQMDCFRGRKLNCFRM